MPRTFIVCPGRTVTLPQGLQAGPGGTNMRLPAECVVTLDDAQLLSHARFINGRERAGDWREIDPKDAPADAVEPIHVGDPNQPATGRTTLSAGTPIVPKKKEV